MKGFNQPVTEREAINLMKELLGSNQSYMMDIDQIIWNRDDNQYVILEFKYVHPRQFKNGITPHNADPNKYYHKSRGSILGLWRVTQNLDGKLYFISHTKLDSEYGNEICVMEILNVDDKKIPQIELNKKDMTFDEFKIWYLNLNEKGRKK